MDVNGSSFGSIMNKEVGVKAVIWKVGTGAQVVGWIDTGDYVWKRVLMSSTSMESTTVQTPTRRFICV